MKRQTVRIVGLLVLALALASSSWADGIRATVNRAEAGIEDQILLTLAPEHRLRIPMQPANRSLNLSNAVAVILYEAWRQQGFTGARR